MQVLACFFAFFLCYSSFWGCLFLMMMRQKVYIHSIYSKSSKNDKMAEKWSGMHFVLAYVKKKLYLCTRLCIYGRKRLIYEEKIRIGTREKNKKTRYEFY